MCVAVLRLLLSSKSFFLPSPKQRLDLHQLRAEAAPSHYVGGCWMKKTARAVGQHPKSPNKMCFLKSLLRVLTPALLTSVPLSGANKDYVVVSQNKGTPI